MKFNTSLSAVCLLTCISLPSFSQHVESLTTVEAKQESVAEYQLLDGQIESVNKSTISAQTSGVISKLKYDVGDFVKKGSEIARISSQNQKAGLQEAKASVGQARASVGQAKAAVSRARASVSKANASISQAAATVSQAQAALRETQAAYTEARLAFERTKRIYHQRLIAKSQYDKADSAVKSAAARVDSAKANLTATKAAFNASKSGLASAKSELQASLSGLEAAKSGFNASKAGLSKAGEQLGYTQLLAPYSGIVIERHVELGEVVAAGKPVMTGISLSEMRATASIPQRLILAVRKHKSARIYLDGDSVGIPAKSLTIFPYADPATNGFKVRVALERGIKGLFPGVFVKIGFETGASTHLVIPQRAVAYRGEVTAVYVVDEHGTPHLRQVRLGKKTIDGKIQVTAGLDAAEKVALDPVHAAAYLKLHRTAVKEASHE